MSPRRGSSNGGSGGGGGGPVTLAGDVTGPSGSNQVTEIQGTPIDGAVPPGPGGSLFPMFYDGSTGEIRLGNFPLTGDLSGDLGGTGTTPFVDAFQGYPLDLGTWTPVTSNVMTWDGTKWTGLPAPGGLVSTGDVTNAGPGGDNIIVKLQTWDFGIAGTPVLDEVIAYNGTQFINVPIASIAPGGTLAGDVTGAPGGNTVVAIQNVPVDAPSTDLTVATYDLGTNTVVWAAPGGDPTMTGDVTGTASNNTVEAIRNIPVNAATQPGAALYFNSVGSTLEWSQGAPVSKYYRDATYGVIGAPGTLFEPARDVNTIYSGLPVGNVVIESSIGTQAEDISLSGGQFVIELTGNGRQMTQGAPFGTVLTALNSGVAAVNLEADARVTNLTVTDATGGASIAPVTSDGSILVELSDMTIDCSASATAARLSNASVVRVDNVRTNGIMRVDNCAQTNWNGLQSLGAGLTAAQVLIDDENASGTHVFEGGSYGNTILGGGPNFKSYGNCMFTSFDAGSLDETNGAPNLDMDGSIDGSLLLRNTGATTAVLNHIRIRGNANISGVGSAIQTDMINADIAGDIRVGDLGIVNLFNARYDEKRVTLAHPSARILRGPQGRLAEYTNVNNTNTVFSEVIYTTLYDASFTLKASVLASNFGQSLTGKFEIEALYRIISGTMSIVGTPTVTYMGDVTGWLCYAATDGTNITIETVGDNLGNVWFQMHTQIFERSDS